MKKPQEIPEEASFYFHRRWRIGFRGIIRRAFCASLLNNFNWQSWDSSYPRARKAVRLLRRACC